ITRSLFGDTNVDFMPKEAKEGQPEDRGLIEPGTELAGKVQADARTLLSQASEAMPARQEALDELNKLAKRLDRTAPELQDTMREYSELAKSAREMLPDVRRTNEEIQVTIRTWGQLGERSNILLQTNQEKLIRAVDEFNETVSRIGRVFSDENQRNLNATLK